MLPGTMVGDPAGAADDGAVVASRLADGDTLGWADRDAEGGVVVVPFERVRT